MPKEIHGEPIFTLQEEEEYFQTARRRKRQARSKRSKIVPRRHWKPGPKW